MSINDIKKTDLFRVMVERGDDGGESDVVAEIKDMRKRVDDGEDPEEVLYDVGLEPDYLFDLI